MSKSHNQRYQSILTLLDDYKLNNSGIAQLEPELFPPANYDTTLAIHYPELYQWTLELKAIRTISSHNVLTQFTTVAPFILNRARNEIDFTPQEVTRFQDQLQYERIFIPQLPVSMRDLTTELYLQIYQYQHYISGIGNQTVLGFSSGSGKLARILDVGLCRYVGFDVRYAISFDLRTGISHWYDFRNWNEDELLGLMSLSDVKTGSYHSYF